MSQEMRRKKEQKERDRDVMPKEEGGLLAAGSHGSLKHCELFLNRD